MRRMNVSKRTGGDGRLHIEAPGCIVNIRCNLHNSDGAEVTSIEVIPDGPDYDGRGWTVVDGIRIIRVVQNPLTTTLTDAVSDV